MYIKIVWKIRGVGVALFRRLWCEWIILAGNNFIQAAFQSNGRPLKRYPVMMTVDGRPSFARALIFIKYIFHIDRLRWDKHVITEHFKVDWWHYLTLIVWYRSDWMWYTCCDKRAFLGHCAIIQLASACYVIIVPWCGCVGRLRLPKSVISGN